MQCGGSAFIPDVLVKNYIESGELFEVPDVEHTSRDIFVAYHKDNEQKQLLEKLVNLLIELGPKLGQ